MIQSFLCVFSWVWKGQYFGIGKCACMLILISESVQPYRLRCKACSLGKHLEIHNIYILILEYYLKWGIKYCDRYRLNTAPSNIALWVEVVAVKLQKHLGSVRWSVQDMFHPHNWKTWTSKQTSGISKIMNRYQNNREEIRQNFVMQWVTLFWQSA